MKNLENHRKQLILVRIFVFQTRIIFNNIFNLELETEIEQLRETQKKYGNILKLAKSMATQFQCFILTQVRIKDYIIFIYLNDFIIYQHIVFNLIHLYY